MKRNPEYQKIEDALNRQPAGKEMRPPFISIEYVVMDDGSIQQRYKKPGGPCTVDKTHSFHRSLEAIHWPATVMDRLHIKANCPACGADHRVQFNTETERAVCLMCGSRWMTFEELKKACDQAHPAHGMDSGTRDRLRQEMIDGLRRQELEQHQRRIEAMERQMMQAPRKPNILQQIAGHFHSPPPPAPPRRNVQAPPSGFVVAHGQPANHSHMFDALDYATRDDGKQPRLMRYEANQYIPTLEKVMQSMEDMHHDHYHKLLNDDGLLRFWQVIRRHVEMIERNYSTHFGHDESLGRTFKTLAAECRNIIKEITVGADTDQHEHQEQAREGTG